MNWFNLTLQLKGFPITKAKAKLEEIKKTSEESYASYLEKRKQSIIDFHFHNNGFYRELCNQQKPERWEEVPVLTKANFQQPLKHRLSKGFTKSNCYIGKTSGSSGHPFVFAKNKFCHALTWANVLDKFKLYGIDYNTSYEARFYGIPLDFYGYQKERFKDRLANRYRFPTFNLNDAVLSNYFEEFKRRKFDYINGYTSALVLFAKYLKSQNICLNAICPTLKVCMVTSEMLFDEDRHLLEQQFGVPIVNEYGASEVGLIAFEDHSQQLQVCNSQLFVEILDDKNNNVGPGKIGKIVITDLYNKAQPILRFEIGDTGSISAESSAKDLYLNELTGRTNDIAELPSGKLVPGLTFYYITKKVITDNADVKEFVIEQTGLDQFIVHYRSNQALPKTLEEDVKSAFALYLESDLNIRFKKVDHISRSKSGKLKQFIKSY